jgi:LuxR family maltose regulon positive regulatory protein
MNDTDYPLLATKLHIPELRPDLVSRKSLIERLNKGMRRKLTLISAPAGFGKTTLLSEWFSQSKLPIAWISLDSGDNDPVYFLHYTIEALRSIEPKIGEATLSMLKSSNQLTLDTILISLIQEIETISDDFVLAFDDYHAIDTPGIHQLVELLIDRMPRQMHLAIASRVDPNFRTPYLQEN